MSTMTLPTPEHEPPFRNGLRWPKLLPGAPTVIQLDVTSVMTEIVRLKPVEAAFTVLTPDDR